MFKNESKSISSCKMRRDLKGLGRNICKALRNLLIRKKGFNLLGSIKMDYEVMEKVHVI